MDGEALPYHQLAHILCREGTEDLRRARHILEGELEATKSPGLAQSIETESNGEDVEEGAKHSKDDDGEEGGKELLVVEGDCRVEYDRGKKNVEEQVCTELRKGVRVHSFLFKGSCNDQPE